MTAKRSITRLKQNAYGTIFAAAHGLLLLHAIPTIAVAQDVKAAFELLEPGDGSVELVIKIDQAVTQETLSRFAIELDGIDVTSVAELTSDGQIRILPVQPLAAGEHQLIVYLISDDGSEFTTLGDWPFTTSAGTAEATEDKFIKSYTATARHELTRTLQPEKDKTTGQSAGEFAIQGDKGGWFVDGQINYLAATEREARLTEKGFDIGEYSLNFNRQFENSQLTGQIGHQTFHDDDLLVSQLSRRGMGLTVSAADGRVIAKAFGAKTNDILGMDNPLGLDRENDRLFGGSATVRPLDEEWGKLSLTATGYSGKSNFEGSESVSKGDGFATALQFSTLRDQLRFKAGFASSRFNEDITFDGSETKSSRAWNAGVDYELIPADGSGDAEPPSLRVGLHYFRIGGHFRSLANPLIFSDHEDYQFNLDYAKGPFSINATALHQTNNVEDDPTLPTDRNLQAGLSGSYTLFQDSSGPAWLGSPSISFGAQVNDYKRIKQSNTGFDPDAHMRSAQFMLGFDTTYETWSWGINHSVTIFRDRVNDGLDRVDYSTGLNANWRAGDNFNFGGGLQWIRASTDGTDSGDTLTGNINADLIFIPGVLINSTRYNISISNIDGAFEGGELISELNWTARPGITLAVRGDLRHGDSKAFGADLDDVEGRLGLIFRLSTPAEQ